VGSKASTSFGRRLLSASFTPQASDLQSRRPALAGGAVAAVIQIGSAIGAIAARTECLEP
jgi:hypothetical protein